MTFSKHLTKHAVLFSSVLVGLPMIPVAALSTPIAQLPSQQPATSNTIVIPSTGATIQLSQIRVASIPPVPQNPCPSIYYENPHNQRVVVPSVCRPNLITQQLDEVGILQEVRARSSANIMENPEGVGGPYPSSPSSP